MKYINNLWSGALALLLVTSCADDSLLDYEKVEKPQSIQSYEYLNDYDLLKSYVNRDANPNFKLGVAVDVGAFNNTGFYYDLISSNFDEMTAGWEMKHSAIVQEDGSLSTSRVSKFIDNASAAGLTIYGHTLCWHANQNAEYLNGLIAPTIIPGTSGPAWEPIAEQDFEGDEESNYEYNTNVVVEFTADGEGAEGEGRALKVTNAEERANDWDCQFFVSFDETMVEGEQYRLTMDVRSDADASFGTQAHSTPYNYLYWDFFGTINSSATWSTYVKEITVGPDVAGTGALAINLGKTATSYYFDNIKIEKLNESGGASEPSWLLQSGTDFETDDTSNYQSNENAPMSFTADGTGVDGTGRALMVTNDAVRDEEWNSQFIFTFAPPMEEGEQYKLSMDVRADIDASFSTQAHSTPFNYLYWNFFGTINATTEWTNYTKEFTATADVIGAGAIAFNLGKTATNYYFDNIEVTKLVKDTGGDQIIEKTPEEKEAIISNAMETWISGMMEVTKDYVKVWDVVNEPMDDGSPYNLKSGVGKTDMPADYFYWQDYLGKDYAVKAFNLARQYGNADDIYFINDYNLEWNIDKCKGLIQYVEYIEEQGAQVDGIGSQMHISVGADKEKIEEMFDLLAATGKLIKISELDVGLGDGKQTSEATEEDYMAQAELYQFVIEKYFEKIPVSQQYGITAWSPTDSPAESSWRAGQPIGLWTEGYSRKHAYAGFADGLNAQ